MHEEIDERLGGKTSPHFTHPSNVPDGALVTNVRALLLEVGLDVVAEPAAVGGQTGQECVEKVAKQKRFDTLFWWILKRLPSLYHRYFQPPRLKKNKAFMSDCNNVCETAPSQEKKRFINPST